MSVRQSPVITPAAGGKTQGEGALPLPPQISPCTRVTNKPGMWSNINRLAKWDVRYSRFAMLSWLRFGGAPGPGRWDWP